jgi:hypothetical protein
MTTSDIIPFSENAGTKTFEQGRAFIARTRRQLDRFDRLPDADKRNVSPEEASAIRRLCDELEADIARHLSGN